MLESLVKHNRLAPFLQKLRKAVLARDGSAELTIALFCRSGLHRSVGLSYLLRSTFLSPPLDSVDFAQRSVHYMA